MISVDLWSTMVGIQCVLQFGDPDMVDNWSNTTFALSHQCHQIGDNIHHCSPKMINVTKILGHVFLEKLQI